MSSTATSQKSSNGSKVSKPQKVSKPSDSSRKAPRTRTDRAGLVLPVGRIYGKLRRSGVANRVSAGAPVYLAAALEYIVSEVVELAGKAASDDKRHRITPRHILLVIQNDEELTKMFKHVTISSGGVLPNIHSALLPKRKTKSDSEVSATQH
jgi:histone H2A